MNKYNFNPNKYKEKLLSLITALKQNQELTQKKYHQLVKKFPKSKSQIFTKSEIIAGIREFIKKDQKLLIQKIVMKPVRTLSGVVPVTILTKPYFCPGKCIYCPDDVKMPKSYLSNEPGAQRAGQHNFDPYHQVISRLNAYYANGHPTDKVELIILGGTWSAYPLKYKIWFICQCFNALNHFNNQQITLKNPKTSGESTWQLLKKAQIKNETAKTRCIGLSLETRPDFITKKELIQFRKFGCTKVQIGVQSLNNKVLNLNHRGHGIKETKKAFKLLRSFGFKIQAHWMANLYGSNAKKDIIDFKKLFNNLAYKPDELKIYPTALLKTAKLVEYYKKGLWKPYTDKQLLSLLIKILPFVPQYCRVTRIIRDFSAKDIVSGSKVSNLRQLVENKAKNIQEIRFREIKQEKIKLKNLKFKIIRYQTLTTEENFLQFITLNNKIVAFLRLSLPKIKPFVKELEKSAIIRELHVYGQSLNLKDKAKTQHLGLGAKLINKAEKISQLAGYRKLSVISAIGTKQYYQKRGFKDGNLYQSI